MSQRRKRLKKKEASCGNNEKIHLEEEYKLVLNLGLTVPESHTSLLTHLGCI